MTEFRIEKDTLGEVKVPEQAYYGPETARALENFKISGLSLQKRLIKSLALIKKASAFANMKLNHLNEKIARSIIKATDEVLGGKFDDQFFVDVFQAGAGTSTNMNMNEVLANRALEIIGEKKGNYSVIDPHDHVNKSQSTNDTFHSAIHVAGYEATLKELVPSLEILEAELLTKSKEFSDIIKVGRTHLQDAVPIRLGQEFSAYVSMIGHQKREILKVSDLLRELNLGGTAIGTGINAGKEFQTLVMEEINELTELKFKTAENLFEATQNTDAILEVSGALKTLAIILIKITNDLRLMTSGPRAGFGEITLPAILPGSSIMPFKKNPSIAEMVDMVGFQVIGNDATITLACQAGQLELNVMMPIIAYNFLNSIEILTNAIKTFAEKCIRGIQVNIKKIENDLERDLEVVTALTPYTGYEKAAIIAKKAFEQNKTIRQILLEMKLFPEKKIDQILNLKKLT